MKETIGKIILSKDKKKAKIYRDCSEQGVIYKSWKAYEERPDAVCYVPELSDSLYTKNDFLELCNGQEDIARDIFESVDWQHPETYFDESVRDGELAECEKCGKLYWAYGVEKCPHCGEPKGEG